MSARPNLTPAATASSSPEGAARTGTVIRVPFGRARAPGAVPPRRSAEELAFLPAALEVIETPASPTLRLTAGAICALLTAAVAWSCFARIDEVAVAPGKIVPLGQVKVVQPLETAIIRTIHVEDGDHVRAGQPLVDLDPTEAEADLHALRYDRNQSALDAAAARLLIGGDPAAPFASPEGGACQGSPRALRDGVACGGIDSALVARSHRQAIADLDRHRAEIAGTEADIADKTAAFAANRAQIERDEALLPLLQERYDVARGLYQKHYGPRPPVLDAEQQLMERRADLASARGMSAEIAAQTRSLEARRAQSEAAFLSDALDRCTKALSRLSQLDGEIAKAEQKARERKLVAPVDGTVEALKVHTPGAVVTAADVLMTLVPDGTGIEIEAGVDNKDIGFVREGQEVAIKVDAFPFTRYGLLHGTLRKVGRDAVDSARGDTGVASTGGERMPSGGPEGPLTYPAKVSLGQDWIEAEGRREPIQPGMRVEAEIKTGERRVIEYLLSPVIQAAQEAGRER